MNLQYITDNQGLPTGVFIPISDWNIIINKHKDLQDDIINIPDWQKKEVKKRLTEYKKNPEIALDFYTEIEKIENEI